MEVVHVWLKNGDLEILRDEDDLKLLIESEMGEDVAREVSKLIKAANYTDKKVNTDLRAYETQLDSFNEMCFEILDIITVLKECLQAPRLNRKEILNHVNRIKQAINNEM